MISFTERHCAAIRGVLSCYDRIVITGTIPGLCHAQGMTSFLYANKIRIFDYTKWAEPLREVIRANAERLAEASGLEIEFVRRKGLRKEQRVKEIIAERGDDPGLVHVFSAMESCSSYKPWHNKDTGKTYVRPAPGKCLHYYFYFILADLGLCYLRVPTWAPFRLQFYYNGHNELAGKLRRKGIGHKMLDNAFVQIDDFDQAQRLADRVRPKQLHRRLDQIAHKCCPVLKRFGVGVHWSLMQTEYATDIVFTSPSALQPIYDELVRTAVHAIKAENIAMFLGRKLDPRFAQEMGNDFDTRIQGTRIKHNMGKTAIKMYDKHGMILRIETVANDVSFFKHRRKVEHRDRTVSMKLAPLRKSIYSLPILTELMAAANRRYLDFLSAIDDPALAMKDLDKISKPACDNQRSHRGFNLFLEDDLRLFRAIVSAQFNISGFQNRDLRHILSDRTAQQLSRMLKRLRKHGLIKKIGKRYKYYLTTLGRRISAMALKLREMYIIPALRGSLLYND